MSQYVKSILFGKSDWLSLLTLAVVSISVVLSSVAFATGFAQAVDPTTETSTALVTGAHGIVTASNPVPVIGLNIGGGDETLSSVLVTFASVSGFDPTVDLTALDTTAASGVALYEDDGGVDKQFDASDTVSDVTSSVACAGGGNLDCTVTMTNETIPANDADGGNDFFVVIRTRLGGIVEGNEFTAAIDAAADVVYSGGASAAMTTSITGTITCDATGPTVSSRVTKDLDNDGQIDAITISFSENLDDDVSSLTATVAGYTVASYSYGDANDNKINVVLTESGSTDTEVVPLVQFSANSSLRDRALGGEAVTTTANVASRNGNLATAEGGTTAATDQASPVLTSVVLSKGTYNTVAFGYSEPITLSGGTTSSDGYGELTSDVNKSVQGFGTFASGNALVTSGAGDGTAANTLSGSGTATITITFASETGDYYFTSATTTALSGLVTPLANASVKDASNNQVNTSTTLFAASGSDTWDVVKPTVSSVTVSDSVGNNGKIDTATLVFTGSDMRDSSFVDGEATLGGTGVLTGAFTTGVTANDVTIIFTRTNDTASLDTGLLGLGDDENFNYTAATRHICDLAGNLVDTTTDGNIVTAEITEADGAQPIVTAVAISDTTTRNRVSVTYSEVMYVSNGASTTSVGDLTLLGTLAGFGAFATTGDVTVDSLKNTVGGNATSTLWVDLAGETGGVITSADGVALGGVFTEATVAGIVDLAGLQVNTSATNQTTTVTSAWDLTKPTITSITISDNVGNDGQVDKATILFNSTMRADSFTNANGTLVDSSANDEAGTFTTAANPTIVFDVTVDTTLNVDTSADGTDFIYSGTTTKITDNYGNPVNTTVDGTIVDADKIQTDGASPVLTTVVLSKSTYNTIAFGYSENITISSTTSADGYGELADNVGTVEGFGNFGNNGTAVTNNQVSNTLSGSTTSTITITFASQTGDYYFTSASVDEPSGTVAPLAHANVTDGINQVNTSGAAITPSGGGTWDLTKPTVSSVTVSDSVGNNGKIDTATLVFTGSDMRDSSFANGEATLGDGANTGAFTSGVTPNDVTIIFTRTADTADVDTGLLGGDGVFNYTAATRNICDLAGNLVDTTSDGSIVTAEITEVDGAQPIVTAVAISDTTTRNRVSVTYSEVMYVSNGASTTSVGDLTTVGILAGFGTFATTGDVTVNTLKNTVGGNATSTLWVDLAGETGGVITSADGVALGGVFTEATVAGIVDAAGLLVNTSATNQTTTVTSAWYLTKPTITSITISDNAGNDGQVDKAIILFNSTMRTASFTDADGTLADSSAHTEAGTFITAANPTIEFNVTEDTDLIVDTSADGTDFVYSGITTKITDNYGNPVNTTVDGTIVDADKVQTDGASPILKTVTFATSGGYNSLQFGYSESMALANGAASTAGRGALVSGTPGTISGIGSFATPGDITVAAATYNTITVSTSTITVTFANQTNGYWTGGLSAVMAGNVTPLAHADITDGTNTVNTNGAVVPPLNTAGAVWDTAQPTVSSITFSSADSDGRIDTQTLDFSENIDDTYVSAAVAVMSSDPGTHTCAFSGTADDDILVCTRSADDAAQNTATGTESNFSYTATGATNYIRDLAGNLLNTTTDGSITTAEVTELDDAEPYLLTAVTLDVGSNGTTYNGKIDHLELHFTESLDDSDISNYSAGSDYTPSGLAVAVVSDEAVDASETPVCPNDTAEDDAYLCVIFTEDAGTCSGSTLTGCDTDDVDQDITWTGLTTTTIQDAAGNNALALASGGVTEADNADPMFVGSISSDANANGTVDRVTLYFSETVDITDPLGEANGFAGLTFSDNCVVSNQDLTSNSVTNKAVTLDSCTAGTSITVDPIYEFTGAYDIKDESAATNEMADEMTVTGTDGAAPVITSALFFDDNDNGTVDRIRTTWSETVVVDADADTTDFGITGGSITATYSDAPELASPGAATYDITVTADTNETSASLLPTVNYIAGQHNPVHDLASSSNYAVASTSAVSVADGASPRIISGTYSDSTSNGKVDRVTLVYTEIVDFSYAAADWEFSANSINLAGDFAAGIADCNTGSATIVCTDTHETDVTAHANETGGSSEPTWAYSNHSNIIDQAVANNEAVDESETLIDGAAPITLTRTYTDNGANGSVDRLVMTYSESVTWNGSDLSQFAVVAQELTGFAGAPTAVSGSTTSTLTMTVAATTNITGATTAPTVAYTQSVATPANRVQDSSGNYLANYTAANITDAAAPVILTGTYSSAGLDGEVDTYTMTTTTDTGLACNSFDGDNDVTVNNDGTVLIAVANSDTCADNNINTFTITITDSLALNTTGGADVPVISYTTNASGLADGAGNDVPSKASLTLSDAAVPIILSGVYADSAIVDGEVDRVVYTTSADVGLDCTGFVGGTTFTVGTAGTVVLAAAVGDTCSTNGTSAITITLSTQGATDTTGGAVNPIVTLDNPTNGIEDGEGNDLLDSTSLTLADAAAPYVISATYSDSNSSGKVDRVVLAFTENTTFVYAAGDWNFGTAGSITLAGDFLVGDCSGSTTATITCTDINNSDVTADANETGGTTQPVWSYTNNGNVRDGLNNEPGNFTRTLVDGARPILISASPASGGQLIPATADFTLTFSEDLLDGSVTTSNIVVTASSGTPTYTVADSSGVVTVTTNGATFSTGVTATVTVLGDTAEVRDASPAANLFNSAGTVFGTQGTGTPVPTTDAYYSFTTLNPSSGGGGGGGGASTVSVVSDAVTVTAPNGGEQLTGGAGYTITWTSTGNVNNVMLYYSVDGGTNFGLIAAGTSNDGSYSWTVPNTATSQARVKIVGRDSGGATLATDMSNTNFIISTTSVLPIVDAPVGTGNITTTPDGYMGRTEAEASLPETVNVDYLVRAPDDGDPTTDYDTTVYYIGLDAKRHPFPNSQVYFTWYENFNNVRSIDVSVLSEMTLGSPVLTRPGTLMVKIQSDPRTFAVEPGDYTIRWVPTEEVAVALYGSNWNKRIMDIEPTYFTRFTMGSDLTAALHPAGSVLQSAAGGTKYYYDGTSRREFASDGAFTANMFQTKYVITAPTSTGWLDATVGAAITGFEDTLFSLQR